MSKNSNFMKLLCLSSVLCGAQTWAFDGGDRPEYRPTTVQSTASPGGAQTLITREEMINRHTEGMDGRCKAMVIQTFANMPQERLTQAFEELINRHTEGMNGYHKACEYDKACVIKAFGNIPQDRLTQEFEELINRHTEGMAGRCKAVVIQTFANMPQERLTQAFEELINRHTEGMDRRCKAIVIQTFGHVPPERIPAFEALIARHTEGMDGFNKACVIDAFRDVPQERYQAFEELINRHTEGMDGDNKVYVIQTFANVPQERYQAFEELINRHTEGMDGFNKAMVIQTFGNIPQDRLTQEFEELINRHTEGMAGHWKAMVIKAFGSVPQERYQEINASFTDQQLQDLSRFVLVHERAELIRRIIDLPTPEERAREINRVIAEYRLNHGRQQPGGNAFEIHNFANAAVTPLETPDRSSQHPTMRLNDAVMDNIQGRMTTGVVVHDMETTLAALYSWIVAYHKDNEEQAFDAIQKAIDLNDAAVLPLVYSFIQHHHPTEMDLWMQAFLDESLNAYEPGQKSCIKGMRERVITSLRFIDSELDSLFKQVEGPKMAPMFIRNNSRLNQTDVATRIIRAANLTSAMTAEEAVDTYEAYLRAGVLAYSPNIAPYEDEISTARDIMERFFDTHIKPLIPEITARQALEAEEAKALKDIREKMESEYAPLEIRENVRKAAERRMQK